MGVGWRDWSKSDVIYGIIVPVIVVLVIVGLSRVGSILGIGFSGSSGIIIGIIMELEELTVAVGVPLLLGLVWNRWAGGASGFLMGSLYALYWGDQYTKISSSGTHVSAGAVLLGYVISA